MGRKTSDAKAMEAWREIDLALRTMNTKPLKTRGDILLEVLANEAPAGTLRLVRDVVVRAARQGRLFDD